MLIHFMLLICSGGIDSSFMQLKAMPFQVLFFMCLKYSFPALC